MSHKRTSPFKHLSSYKPIASSRHHLSYRHSRRMSGNFHHTSTRSNSVRHIRYVSAIFSVEWATVLHRDDKIKILRHFVLVQSQINNQFVVVVCICNISYFLTRKLCMEFFPFRSLQIIFCVLLSTLARLSC